MEGPYETGGPGSHKMAPTLNASLRTDPAATISDTLQHMLSFSEKIWRVETLDERLQLPHDLPGPEVSWLPDAVQDLMVGVVVKFVIGLELLGVTIDPISCVGMLWGRIPSLGDICINTTCEKLMAMIPMGLSRLTSGQLQSRAFLFGF